MKSAFSFLQKIYFSLIYFYNRKTLILKGAVIGNNLEVFTSFLTQDVANLAIGNNVLIGRNCRFYAANGIVIGNDVLIANDVSIISVDHKFSDSNKPMNKQGLQKENRPIVIEDDVWIGDKAIILKKVRLGKGSVIGAGAVVTKDVPERCIVAGNPAKVIRRR